MVVATKRAALHAVLDQMRALAAGDEIKQSTNKDLQEASKAAWSMTVDIFSSCIGFANAEGEKHLSQRNSEYFTNVCKDLRMPYGKELDEELLYGDKLPMSDSEFDRWLKILTDATWNDNDPRFAGKTVGEMWEILINEDHFPKNRFYNELKRRGIVAV